VQSIFSFDCRSILSGMEDESFLKQDTHWTPAAAERTAEALAQKILALNRLSEQPSMEYTRRAVKNSP